GDELFVPDLQACRVTAACGPGRLEQRAALLNDAFIVGADPRVARAAGDEQIIEVSATLGRIAFDDRQVLRCEQNTSQRAERIPGPAQRGAVEPGPVCPA